MDSDPSYDFLRSTSAAPRLSGKRKRATVAGSRSSTRGQSSSSSCTLTTDSSQVPVPVEGADLGMAPVFAANYRPLGLDDEDYDADE